MKTNVRVAVIGGGVVGCSVLFHLTKLGWKDVVLIERDELTSGSTWHAAGGMHTLNSDPNVSKLQAYTMKLYHELEEISGQSCGIHITGGYMCAGTQERLDFLKTMRAKAKYMGLEFDFVDLSEVAREHPLVDVSHFAGAVWDPNEGHIDPSGVTNAYAKAARIQGAEVYRHNPVVDIKPRSDGTWDVITKNGTIHAEHVVNAGGLWAREVGRMVGIELPIIAMEHHYLLTEAIPEVVEREKELPHLVDFEAEIYTRQEGQGFLVGTYEQQSTPWAVDETSWDFGHELLQPDLERIAPSIEMAFKHFPILERTGIKQAINGPFTFAPDGNPLVGPVPGLRNFWTACGVMAGFSQGGGVGLSLAEWMIEGEPSTDIMGMDVARFGPFASKGYTYHKAQEFYRRRFSIVYPNEELPVARPLRTSPLYDIQKSKNAVFGAAYGLEAPLWFAPEGMEPHEKPTYLRSNAFEPTAAECKAVREGVGIMEITGFAKYDVTGPNAEAWLSELLANRMPREGRMMLSPMLAPTGKIIGDFTIAKLSDEYFMIFGSGAAENYHMRWFQNRMPDSGVSVRPRRVDLAGVSIAGPKSRELLSRLTHGHQDITAEGFKFLDFKPLHLGMVDALVGRITFTGDLGYEIWVESDYLRTLYHSLFMAGEDLGLRDFGSRALNSLRLEKSFGGWMREYRPDYTPLEAGMDRFVDLRKNSFVGREAVMKQRDEGVKRKLITLEIDVDQADAMADEPIFFDGGVVGWVTSGGFSHHTGKSLALGYVKAEAAEGAEGYAVEILGDIRPARRLAQPIFDPEGARMRS